MKSYHRNGQFAIKKGSGISPGTFACMGEKSALVDGAGDCVQGGQSGKADGLAVGGAAEHLGVAVGEETAHIVADHIKARDGGALGRDGLKIGIDAHAVHRGQQPASDRNAVEGALLDGGHVLGHLAEVIVHAAVAEFIVALNALEEVFFVFALKAELVSQLFQRVGLLELAAVSPDANLYRKAFKPPYRIIV